MKELTEAESLFCNHIADVVNKKWSSLDLVSLFNNEYIKSYLQEVLVKGKEKVLEVIRKYPNIALSIRQDLSYKEYEMEREDVLDSVFYTIVKEGNEYHTDFITEYFKIGASIIRCRHQEGCSSNYKLDKIFIKDILSVNIVALLNKENIALENQSVSLLKTLFDLQTKLKQLQA